MKSQKLVLKMDLHNYKDKQKAMKAISTLDGIDTISMDMKGQKLTVVGHVDPVHVTIKLRKGCPSAEILSVGPVKEEDDKKKPEEKDDKKPAEAPKLDQRRRGKQDGKAAEKSQEKAPDAQGAQRGKGKKEAKPPRIDKSYGQQDQTCYKCGIRGHYSRICEKPQYVIDASRKANIEAHIVALDTTTGVDATGAPATTTPLDILATATDAANKEAVTQEQIFAELDTLIDLI